jgi:hypothetical protein
LLQFALPTGTQPVSNKFGGIAAMARPRAADDFVVIKRRMEELQRERAQAMRRHDDDETENDENLGRRLRRAPILPRARDTQR